MSVTPSALLWKLSSSFSMRWTLVPYPAQTSLRAWLLLAVNSSSIPVIRILACTLLAILYFPAMLFDLMHPKNVLTYCPTNSLDLGKSSLSSKLLCTNSNIAPHQTGRRRNMHQIYLLIKWSWFHFNHLMGLTLGTVKYTSQSQPSRSRKLVSMGFNRHCHTKYPLGSLQLTKPLTSTGPAFWS